MCLTRHPSTSSSPCALTPRRIAPSFPVERRICITALLILPPLHEIKTNASPLGRRVIRLDDGSTGPSALSAQNSDAIVPEVSSISLMYPHIHHYVTELAFVVPTDTSMEGFSLLTILISYTHLTLPTNREV